MGTSAKTLIESVGLSPCGPADWASDVPYRGPGVYVVEVGEPMSGAPIDYERAQRWLDRVPSLRLEGEPPTAKALADHLAKFWWPGETVVYVGCTTRPLAKRISEFYGHVLGDDAPHRGGQWLKTLRPDVGLRIWWAETDDAVAAEARLLAAFRADLRRGGQAIRERDDAGLLPFANLETERKQRKPHAISRASLRRPKRSG